MQAEEKIKDNESWWASVLAEENLNDSESAKQQTQPNERKLTPAWEQAQRLYEEDALVSLQVVDHNRGGVLVEGEGIRGFVPHSHLLDLDNNGEREEKLAAYKGKTLLLKLIECVPEEDRIVFSERAAQAGTGRRRELFATLSPGDVVDGEVTNITDFGVFVELGGVEGLVHISELSWGRVGHPQQVCQRGEKIRVQILNLSRERCRVALSIKRLIDNPWKKVHEQYQSGQIIPAKITALLSFGAFARLEGGIEGLIHDSEIPSEKRKFLKEGAKMDVRILEIEARKQRMSLSLDIEGNYG